MAGFTNKDDYEKLMGSLSTIKGSIYSSITFANNETFNFYLEDMEAYYTAEVETRTTPCAVTLEEVQENVDQLPEINFFLTNQTAAS